MFKNGKILGLINILDFAIILMVSLGLLGVYLVKSKKFVTSSKIIEKKEQIQFDISLRGVKLSTSNPIFIAGQKSFLTIRNVPYTELNIVKAVKGPVLTLIDNPRNPLKPLAVADIAEANAYDFIVTLKDDALITKDGPVIGGNKIKIGLVVSLEGEKYRLNGVVTDVRYN